MEHSTDNPYVGPRTFKREEAHLFFGREREARDLLSLVIFERLVLFYAQSGGGKSSMINTRLIPGLEEDKKFKVLPIGRVGGELQPDFKGDNIFIYNLLLSLSRGKGEPVLPDPNMTLNAFLQQYYPKEPATTYDDDYIEYRPQVLIIDQFEEILITNLREWEKREDFFIQLRDAMEEDDHLWIVLSMREDYVAGLDPYAHLLPGKLKARFYLQRMGFEAALQAVKEPVSKSRPFEPGVAERLVDNLRQISVPDQQGGQEFIPGEHVKPVQLQVVCRRLWEKLKDQEGTRITHGDLERLAGGEDPARFVDKALGQFYEETIAQVAGDTPGRTEFDLRNWFEDKLIFRSKYRALVSKGVHQTGGLDNDIVKRLEDEFFLLGSVSRAGTTSYELVHDRFIAPILQSNDDWLTEHRLIRDALDWQRFPAEDKLYRGQQLADAGKHPDAEIDKVQKFLEASEKAGETARRERLRRLILIAAVIFLGVAVFTGYQWREAVTAREEADRARAEAVEAKEKEADLRIQERAIARRAKLEGEALDLANAAGDALDRDPDLSVLLAIQAVRTFDEDEDGVLDEPVIIEAEDALNQAVLGSRLQLTLRNRDTIHSVAFSPDGTRLATPYGDQTAKIWDAASGRELLTLSGHTDKVIGVAFSPECVSPPEAPAERCGTRLATASQDGTAKLWDADSGEELLTLEGHTEGVYGISFSSDGSRLATASKDATAVVWDADSGEELLTLEGHTEGVYGISFSPDGNRLATASKDETAVVWDIASGEKLFTLRHKDFVNRVLFSPDGSRLATSSDDGTAKVWDVDSGQELLTFDKHEGIVEGLAWSPEGDLLATASEDTTVKIWDAAYGRELLTLDGHGDRIWNVAFSPGGTRLATASFDGTAKVWNVSFEDEYEQLWAHPDQVLGVAFSPDSTRLATVGADGTSKVWDVASDRETLITSADEIAAASVAFNSDGTLLLTASTDDEAIRRWHVDTFQEIQPPISHTEELAVTDIALSPDGTLLATVNTEGTARVWDTGSGIVSQTWEDLRIAMSDAAYLPYGCPPVELESEQVLEAYEELLTRIVEGLPAEIVEKYSPECLKSLLAEILEEIPEEQVSEAQGQPSSEFTEQITRKVREVISEHEASIRQPLEVWGIAFSPGGTRLAIGDAEKVWVWDIESGDELFTLLSPDQVTGIAFNSDGTRLAIASWNDAIDEWGESTEYGVVKVADIETCGQKSLTLPSEKKITSLAFSPDGAYLAAGRVDGIVRLYTLDVETLLAVACQHTNRNLTHDEWKASLGEVRGINQKICPDLPVHVSFIQEYIRNDDIDSALAIATPEQVAEAFIELGREYSERGKYGEAVKALGRAAEQNRELKRTEAAKLAKAYNDVCLSSSYSALTPAWTACYRAATLAAETENIALNHDVCRNAGIEGLRRAVRPACERVVDLAAETEDVLFNFDICQDVSAYGLEDTAQPACEQAVDLAVETGDAPLQLDICQRGIAAGLEELVLPACEQAVILARQQEDVSLNWSICQSAAPKGFEDLFLSACEHVAELALAVSFGEVVTRDDFQAVEGDIWTFRGAAGQIVTIAMEEAGSGIDPYLTLFGPDMEVLAEAYDSGYGNARIEGFILPEGGAFIVKASDLYGDFGAYTLSLTEAIVEPINFGVQVKGDLADDVVWTFEGKAGQMVEITMNEDGSGLDTLLALKGPDWMTWVSDDDGGVGTNSLIYTVLKDEGTYTIVPGGYEASAGAYTLSLLELTEEPIDFDVQVEGDLADGVVWAFEGRAGQIVSIEMNEDRSGLDTFLTLRGPDGTMLSTDDNSGSGTNSLIRNFVLIQEGTYTIFPGGYGDSGAYTLSLGEGSAEPLSFGETVRQDIEDGDIWTFQGTAGQIVTIAMDEAGSGIDPYLTLFGPDGRLLEEDYDSGGGWNARIDGFVLPEDGAYIIKASDLYGGSGAYTLSLTEAVVEVIDFGVQVEGDLADGVVWAFEGKAGQIVSIEMNEDRSGLDTFLTLKGPDGTTLSTDDNSGSDTDSLIRDFVLTQEGTYTIFPGGYGDSGAYTLSLREGSAEPIDFGETVRQNIEDGDIWTFQGTAGQIVTIAMDEAESGIDPYLTLFGPDGRLLEEDYDSGGGWNARIDGFVLPEDGAYIIKASDLYGGSGAYTLSLTEAIVEPIDFGGEVEGDLADGAVWAFEGQSGQVVRIEMSGDGGELDALLTLKGLGGTTFTTDYGTNLLLLSLPETDTYFISVQGYEEGGGKYTLALDAIEAGLLNIGDTVSDEVTDATGDYWTFYGADGDGVTISMDSDLFEPHLELYGPDGNRLMQGGEISLMTRSGPYVIIARGVDGETGPYTLSLTQTETLPIPQDCNMDDATAGYGPITVGSTVVLGRHRPVNGSENWNSEMDQYVGMQATVTQLAGTDGEGCPGVWVDVDDGEWFWRIREMSLFEQ